MPTEENTNPATPIIGDDLALLATTPENELTVENKVRCTIVHTLVRGQPPECEVTAHKLNQIFMDLSAGSITKEESIQQLDELVAGDIATYITDPTTKHFMDIAVDAIRGM